MLAWRIYVTFEWVETDLRDFHFKRYLIWCRWGVSHTSSEFKDGSRGEWCFQGGKQMCRTGAGGGLGLFRLGPPAIRHTTGTKPRVDPGSPGVCSILAWVQCIFCIPFSGPILWNLQVLPKAPRYSHSLEVIRCSNKLTNEKSAKPVVPICWASIHLTTSSPWYLGLNLSHIRENLEQKPMCLLPLLEDANPGSRRGPRELREVGGKTNRNCPG